MESALITINDFNRTKRRFIEWLTLDKFTRIPSTQKALAKVLGVTEQTLCRWKTPELMGVVSDIIRDEFGDRYRAEVYAAIAREAVKGSFQHAQLALQLMGDIEAGKGDDNITAIQVNFSYGDQDKAPERQFTIIAPSTNGSNGTEESV